MCAFKCFSGFGFDIKKACRENMTLKKKKVLTFPHKINIFNNNYCKHSKLLIAGKINKLFIM